MSDEKDGPEGGLYLNFNHALPTVFAEKFSVEPRAETMTLSAYDLRLTGNGIGAFEGARLVMTKSGASALVKLLQEAIDGT